MTDVFINREQAGKLLAERLRLFRHKNPLVLALPRGGIPVAFEVARLLAADLELVMVKKIGVPGHPEVAVGAVSEDAIPYLNEAFIKTYKLDHFEVQRIAESKIREIRSQISDLRGERAVKTVQDRTVILVDDGIATGATMLTAVEYVRSQNPKEIIVACPVASGDGVYKLQAVANDVIVLRVEKDLRSVGEWYEDFTAVEDKDILKMLHALNPPRAPGAEL